MIYSSDTLSISELVPDDALQLNKLLVSNTERFIRFLPLTLADNRTLESTRNYIERKIKAADHKEEFVYVMKDQYQIQIIGLIILKQIHWDTKQGEFAYCIGERYKGKGLMSEAIRAVSLYVSQELGLKTLHIISHKTNESSVNVALNAGYKWKKTLVKEYKSLNETPMDMELFELKT
ncbi:ribosomal-protein-alanine N-acetyltransferase [Gelidibacter sediminis]|uniref:Ribosomal-protein-alanine N-acetyltransferase n=1 Tax=Gelidibacter sediminis TaxID=1608710 RepID=A0A4R7Q7T2_9FLAO|nr:GNAT family N-acetyltransferase [Gelidibacter sediminis]TDU43604.1 ribosomal-protein-alanine N-acetyltransferase [Gelidibacter sediminis]